jgi:hypothetical protein
MNGFVKRGGKVIKTVLSSLLVYFLTVGCHAGSEGASSGTLPTTPPDGSQTTNSSTTAPPTTTTTTTTAPSLSFVERLSGDWILQSWTETGGPTTLYIEVSKGALTATEAGQVDWRLEIDEHGEQNRPQPAIHCGGQTTLAGRVEGVPGGARNSEVDWTGDLRSINYSSTGEDRIGRALCGWATIGTRAPYAVTMDRPETAPAIVMEMANKYGTFRWRRA